MQGVGHSLSTALAPYAQNPRLVTASSYREKTERDTGQKQPALPTAVEIPWLFFWTLEVWNTGGFITATTELKAL